MRLCIILFFISLVLAQLGALTIIAGVTVYLHDVILIALLVVTAYHTRHQKRTWPRIAWPVMGFFLIGQLSLLFNGWRYTQVQFAISELYLLRWLMYAALAWLVALRHISSRFWLVGLFWTGVGICALGLVQYILYPDLRNLYYLGWDPHLYRLFSTLLDPNFTGLVLVLTILLGICLWTMTRQSWIIVLTGLVCVALLLTYSRSSYLAFVAGTMVYTLFYQNIRRWMVLGLFLFIATLVFLPTPGGIGVDLLRQDTIFSRLNNWSGTVQYIFDSPIVGYGFNGLRYILGADADSHAGAGVDNSLLFILLTTGVVGLASYSWIIARAQRNAFQAVSVYKTKFIGLLLIASTVAIVTHGMFLNSLFYPIVMAWWWILVGVTERPTFDT